MVRQKTISLDEQTAIIAGRMQNFSGWVRQQLIEHARTAKADDQEFFVQHKAPESARVWGVLKSKCNPRHKNGVCLACYPEGVE